MTQQFPSHQSQEQDNFIKDINVGHDLTFAPVQNIIETQIIQSSFEAVTQRKLNKNSPYQGLKRYNVKDRDRFFGRDKLITKLLEAVNRSSLSLVLGASGSGKSSVIRAGLIPELKISLESEIFYDFIFTPNEDPFNSLYRCLLNEEKDYNFSKLEAEIILEAKADTLTKVISTLKKEEERWLIFVDQFEELFTICGDLEKRKNFIEGLVQVANSSDRSVKIILAMRSDFLEQFSFYRDLGAIVNQNNIHLVTEMYPDELRQAIEQPALKHGVVFEEGLIEQIIEEVKGQKGYLPLLEYTLDLLWASECRDIGTDGHPSIEDRILNKTTYVALEGVRGALQKRVNEIYSHLTQDEQTTTKQIFLKIVNIVDTDSGSRVVSRRAYRDEFVGEATEKILNSFIEEKLLVSSSQYSSLEQLRLSDSKQLKQSATVEIAHEILLSSWDVLKRWLEQEKEAVILKNWLNSETRRWQKIRSDDQSKAQDELLKGSRLDRVVDLRNKDAFKNVGGLSKEENQFIDFSIEYRDRQLVQEKRRKRDRALIGSAIGAMTIAVIAVPLTLAGNILWTLQHRANVAFAKPGQNISGKTYYRLTYNQALIEGYPPAVINQIVFGIPGEIESTDCINVGILDRGDQRGEYSINLTAPQKPGVYYIQFGAEAQFDCDSNERAPSAKKMWQSRDLKIDPEKSMIGVVIVGNSIDIISHWSKIVSAFDKNIPKGVTKVNIGDEGAMYVSLQDFSINPAMSKKMSEKYKILG